MQFPIAQRNSVYKPHNSCTVPDTELAVTVLFLQTISDTYTF
jgi:hypothetical protein